MNDPSNNVSTALIEATTEGYKDCVHIPIESGADVNQQTFNGETAIHQAAHFGHDTCLNE